MGAGRRAEPWYWHERKGWYATVKGKRRPLLKARDEKTGKSEAWKVLIRILAEEDSSGVPKTDALDCQALIELFMRRVRRECKETTRQFYASHIEPFSGFLGPLPCAELRPKHVNHFLDAEGEHWSDSTRRGVITAIKAMSSWSTKQGYLSSDPLKGMSRPKMGRRESVDPRIAPLLLNSAGDEAFADLLIALFESGCRPGEVYKVTAEDCDLEAGTWRLHGKTTDRTGKDRVIYLTPRLVEITRRLAERNPRGPIFLNSEGNPWNRNAVRCRFLRRRDVLGPIQAYGLRHLFGTDALTRHTPGVVAALMGHSDLKMLVEHYGHVDERSELLRAAASDVRPSAAYAPSKPDPSVSGPGAGP
jgi:integrase